MLFKRLSEYFAQLEAVSSRLEMTRILADLFKEADSDEIGKLCYLLQGRVAPLFEAIEFGMADRMMIRAVATALNITADEVNSIFKKEGDMGKTVEQLKSKLPASPAGRQITNLPPSLKLRRTGKSKSQSPKILDVYDVLFNVATVGGEGSQEQKVNLLGSLIKEVDSLSARYIVRIPLNKLRLGFSDMTILDALSWTMTGTKEHRAEIEKAYNVRPDLGFISQTIKDMGIKGLKHVKPKVGTPILMMRAERMSNGADIIEKLGKCAIEPKYDGFRLQIHYSKNMEQRTKNKKTENLKLLDEEKKEYVKLYSRNLEDVTRMYPDVAEGVRKQVKAKEAIFEGEAIGINIKTGQYLPFQETVQRKRKYDIEVKAKEIPLKLFTFDLLYVDGVDFLESHFTKRRKELERIISKGDDVYIAKQEIIDDPKKLETLFEDTASKGLEGIMAKKLDGVYQAGSRNFNWIKYKKSYSGKLSDTIDCVVMGYDFGQGKRNSFGIGDFLIGVLDKRQEKYVTVAKIGTGLTDEEWRELKIKCSRLRQGYGGQAKVPAKGWSASGGKSIPKNYEVDKAMGCDVWVEPKIVVEIRADEITRSPVHTAGRIMGPSKSGNAQEVKTAGFALRFPRLERFREDKNPEDATQLSEVERMFKLQSK